MRIPKASSNVGAASLGSGGAVAVLGHMHAGGGADQRDVVVEMLKVFRRSPPVPQTSRMGCERVLASSGGTTERARSSRAKAAISSGVSPLRASSMRNSALTSAETDSSINWPTASATCAEERETPWLK